MRRRVGVCRVGVAARPGDKRGPAASAASAARLAASSSLHLALVSILRVEVTTPTMV
jgi:hypothetical protein